MINTARAAIYKALNDAWVADTRPEPLVFQNEAFDPSTVADGVNWCRLSVIHTFGGQETLGDTGNRKFLRSGNVITQVFAPQDEGLFDIDATVQAVVDALEGITLTSSNVRLFGATVQEIGPDAGWFQVNVEIPFEYDVRK